MDAGVSLPVVSGGAGERNASRGADFSSEAAVPWSVPDEWSTGYSRGIDWYFSDDCLANVFQKFTPAPVRTLEIWNYPVGSTLP
jgi:hypothetical protein